MRLIIKNPDKINLDDFCEYLIRIMQIYSSDISGLNAKLIAQWNEYLKVVFPEQHLDVKRVLKDFFKNQDYIIQNGNYIIGVDKNIKIPTTDISIERVAQTIEEGNLDIKGYDIFTQVYQKISNNIVTLYENWAGM